MPNVALYKQDGTQNGEVTLNDAIFVSNQTKMLYFDAIIMQRASLRQGNHSVKNRSAVRGGGRKPWAQKELVVLVKGQSDLHNGAVVESSSDQLHVHTATNFLKKFVA